MKQNLLNKMMKANEINNRLKHNYGYMFGNDDQRYRIGYHV